jgi:hypothetical protein
MSVFELSQGSETLVDEAPKWQPIASAPFGRELELAVVDRDGAHALVFPCRRTLTGWMRANTEERVDVSPTHWRDWAA